METLNSTFFSKITFIKLNSEEIKAILEQVNKISFRNSKLPKFLIKIYSELFLSSYLFISYLESSKKYFYSLNIPFNSASLVKSSICGVILPENVPYLCNPTYSFSFFSVITTFEVTSCIFVLQMLQLY